MSSPKATKQTSNKRLTPSGRKRGRPRRSTNFSLQSGMLSEPQLKAIGYLLDRSNDETIEQIADRVGVSRQTLWKWMQKPEFVAEYKARVDAELGSRRSQVASALIKGATRPGPGQAAMQKIYWQKLGEFSETLNVSAQINVRNSADVSWFEYCTQEEKLQILAIAERAVERAAGQQQTIDVSGSDGNVSTKMIGSGSTDDDVRDDDTDDDNPTTSRLKQVYNTRPSKSDWKPGPGGRPDDEDDNGLIDLMGDD